MAQLPGARGSTLNRLDQAVGASMTKLPLPSLAAIAFDAQHKAAARAAAERQRQLFLEQVDLRYCPGLRDPRLLQTAEEDE
jgi:hypothetical protein